MIVNSKDILKHAYENHYAIPHFNINNLEWIKYILEECEINKSPVILGVSEGAISYIGGYKTTSNLIRNLYADLNITIPVVIHLDHGKSIESCIDAIDSGFTSVMFDGSNLSIQENINKLLELKKYAKSKNVSIEAELGMIGENKVDTVAYAKIDECTTLYNSVNIDSLAPAIGNMHGKYNEIPKLNFNLLKEINDKLNIPLVLHGGSGLSDTDYEESIKYGVAKININTNLQLKWAEAVKKYIIESNNIVDPRKIIGSGEKSMKGEIHRLLKVFKSMNKA